MNYSLMLISLTFLFTSSFDAAVDAYESNKQKIALSTTLDLISNDKNNDQYYELIAKIYYSIGDLDNSNINIVKAIEIKNDNESYRKFQRKLEELKNNIKSTQKTFNAGYIDDAILEYETLIKDSSDFPLLYYNLGLIYLKSSNYSNAVIYLNKAIDIDPYNEEKYKKEIINISKRLAKLGKEKYRIKEYDDALELYLEAIDYYPEFISLLFRITLAYNKINDYENAKKFAEQILFYDNTHYQTMKILGDLHYKLGDIDVSLNFYNRSLVINPEYYQSYYSLAKVLNAEGEYDKAIDNLNQTIDINPNYDKAYILLGVIYSDNSNYKKAIDNFNKAIAIDSNNYTYYWRLAETYNRFEQYSKSKEAAKQSLKIKKNYANAFFELGYAELFMCNKVAAEDAFQKAKKDKTYRKSAKHYLDNINQIFSQNCK